MTADTKGLSMLETLLMSALVFAGTAQLVALELWREPAPILSATLACLVINLRLAPMGAALAPVFDRVSGWRRWGTLAFLVDNAFALTIAETRAGRRDAAYLLGAAVTMWLNWMSMCAIGHGFGAVVKLPPGHPVFFAASAASLYWATRASYTTTGEPLAPSTTAVTATKESTLITLTSPGRAGTSGSPALHAPFAAAR
jgi:predicted branched-subunit amino acid permease